MSAIAASLVFNGPPLLSGQLTERMMAVAAPLGPDGSGVVQRDGVGLGHAHFWITPEEVGEQQPIADAGQRCVLAADARLDNRDELLHALRGLGAGSLDKESDAQLLLQGYLHWGTELFPKLVGDFALVLWDSTRQQLICARDALGQRSLLYHVDRERFLCASLIRQLFVDPTVSRRLADRAIGEHLCGRPPLEGDTFYEEVRRLPAGHWLAASRDGAVRIARFWDAATISPVDGVAAEDQAAEFRERFLRSVRARLRTTSPSIGLHLSGGFDSTAVIAATNYWNQKFARSLDARAFRCIAEHPAADERPFMDRVLARFPMPVTTTTFEDHWALRPSRLWRQWQDEPHEATYISRYFAEAEAAQQAGVRVILTGEGGDELGGSSWYLVDLLLRGKWTRLWPECKQRAAGRGQSPWQLSWMLMRRLIHRLRARLSLGPQRVPRWIDRRFSRRLGLARFARHRRGSWNPGHDEMLEQLRRYWSDPLLAGGQAIYGIVGVELRHPFLDRRLFEWALSVPVYRFGENGRVKAPLRMGLADLLPDSVAQRADKGSYLHYWDLGVRIKERQQVLDLLDRPLSAELGYIDGKRLSRAYEHYCRGGEIDRVQLWNVLSLEAWLRRISPQSGKVLEVTA